MNLAIAALETEKMMEAEIMAEKLGVKDHELDWYQEENDPNFMEEEFISDFASTLKREFLANKPSRKQVANLHND